MKYPWYHLLSFRPPVYYGEGSRKFYILHARLMHQCSSLKADISKMRVVDDLKCSCGSPIEDAIHYLLECQLYYTQRISLFKLLISMNKAVTRVFFLVRQEVWGPPTSPAGPGQNLLVRGPGGGDTPPPSPMKLLLCLKLQGYFGYANDRTHVIKVVVLVVTISIQLTYGIHGFKKKKYTTTSLFNGDVRTKRICRKQICRSSHAFYTQKSTQS